MLITNYGGDISRVWGINHLDLPENWVTLIWMTPEIEICIASYHGYAVTDHYQIDARYGTNELYKTLCRQRESTC